MKSAAAQNGQGMCIIASRPSPSNFMFRRERLLYSSIEVGSVIDFPRQGHRAWWMVVTVQVAHWQAVGFLRRGMTQSTGDPGFDLLRLDFDRRLTLVMATKNSGRGSGLSPAMVVWFRAHSEAAVGMAATDLRIRASARRSSPR